MAVPAPQATNRNDRIDKSYLGRSVRALRDQAMSSLLWVIAMSVATVPATAIVTVTQTGKKVIAPLPVRPKKVIPPIKRPGLYEFGLPFSPDYQWRGGVYAANTAERSCILAASCQFAKTAI